MNHAYILDGSLSLSCIMWKPQSFCEKCHAAFGARCMEDMNKVGPRPQKSEIRPLHCRSEPVDGVDIPTAKKPSVAQEGARVREGIL